MFTCDICGGEAVLKGVPQYHYTESGLQNVYLENMEVLACETCGEESPVIPQPLALHRAIARAIALQPALLGGTEIRFLRKQLGLRARDLARLLRVDASTLSRCENGAQQLGAQSDLLIRLFYVRLSEERAGRISPEPVVEKLSAVGSHREPGLTLFVDARTRVSVWQTLRDDQPAARAVAAAGHTHSRLPPGRLQGAAAPVSPRTMEGAGKGPQRSGGRLQRAA